METFGDLVIGLSFLFGSLLLGLIAELYYVLWWKKNVITNREVEDSQPTTKFTNFLFYWKNRNSVKVSDLQEQSDVNNKSQGQDLEAGENEKNLQLKSYGDESVELELMRLHNLRGPPRFLFTIKEETNEDLENKCLSDFLESPETPLDSPTLETQSLEDSCDVYGFGNLSESFRDKIIRLRSSPPSTFKFLRDAEEKFLKNIMEHVVEKCQLDRNNVEDNVVNKSKHRVSDLQIIVEV